MKNKEIYLIKKEKIYVEIVFLSAFFGINFYLSL